MRPVLERGDDLFRCVDKLLATRHHVGRVQVALHAGLALLHIRRRPVRRNRIVDGDAIRPGLLGKADVALARLAREGDDRQAGEAALHLGGDDAGGLDREILEILTLERAGPAVEELDHFAARLDLFRQVFDRRHGHRIDQRREGRPVGVLELVRRRLILRAAARDHVGGHGPGHARKADEGGFLRQLTRQDLAGLIDRGELVVDVVLALQALDAVHRGHGRHPGAFPGFKPQIKAKRLRQKQDVGKQDRGVKAIAADRLQRHFGGKVRRVAQAEKIARLRAGGAVFGQITARLPHQPHRRRGKNFALEGAQDRLVGHRGPPYLLPFSVPCG